MPTIDDVARAAGVGIGTVSRVLNDSPFVSAALRQRVLDAIERLGYRPSRAAQALGRQRTHCLELLVPLAIGPLFLRLLRGIEEALADSAYTLLVHTIADADDRDRAFEACCSRGRADGALVLWLTPSDALLQRIGAERFPVVLVNLADSRVPSVGVDHDAAARRAVEYCQRLGHRRIALVDRRLDPLTPESPGLCERGYRQGLAAAELACPTGYERMADFSPSGGADALQALLELPEPPTAIIAASEKQAIGVLQAARDRDVRVPAEMSVVGYSDSEYAQHLGLTTIDVPAEAIGRTATRLLMVLVDGQAVEPTPIFEPAQLIVRRTCGPPRMTA